MLFSVYIKIRYCFIFGKRKEPSSFGDFKKEDLKYSLKAETMWIT
jgi:hypothetical protein